MEAKNYRELGHNEGLREGRLEIFVLYMKKAWPKREQELCSSGYGGEWAERWANGMEWNYADSEHRKIIKVCYETYWSEY